MSKWVVEYKTTDKQYWQSMEGIEANDGREATEYVKSHVWGAYRFKAWHDDEDEEEVTV